MRTHQLPLHIFVRLSHECVRIRASCNQCVTAFQHPKRHGLTHIHTTLHSCVSVYASRYNMCTDITYDPMRLRVFRLHSLPSQHVVTDCVALRVFRLHSLPSQHVVTDCMALRVFRLHSLPGHVGSGRDEEGAGRLPARQAGALPTGALQLDGEESGSFFFGLGSGREGLSPAREVTQRRARESRVR